MATEARRRLPTGEVTAADGVLVERRWIPVHTVDWVQDADAKMMQAGAVRGEIRATRDSARWHAQKLIRLMVDLGLHERWELREHTGRKDGGWVWHVEYIGRRPDGH